MAMQDEVVGRHLARLGDADSEGRRAAMHSLKAFVEKLDSGTMPAFLQQVSPTRGAEMASPQSRSFAISLYEEVAKAHGKLIVPHIGRVMATVTRSLASGTSSSPQLHQACARVVAALARHAIDPAAPLAEGEAIVRGLCQPLLEALMAESEPLAAGAALCLQALVESEKWKHAGKDIVLELCSRVSAEVRERGGHRLPQLQLARSLVMAGGPAVVTFAGPFLRAASQILLTAPRDGPWQARVGAARLVHAVLWRVDRRKLPGEEVAGAVEALDICSHDRSPQVRAAAVEALQSAAMRVAEDDNSARQLSHKRMAAEWTGISSSETTSSVPKSPPPQHCSDDPWCAERRRREAVSAESGLDSIWMKMDSAEDAFTEPVFAYEDRRLSDVSENLSAEGSPMRLVGPGTGGESYVDYIQGQTSSSVVSMVTTEVPAGVSPSSTVTVELQQPQGQPSQFLGAVDVCVPFTTPRRLLRSLVFDVDTVSNGMETLGDGTHLDMETCSNSSWSVRNNPIADEEALNPDDQQEGALECSAEAQGSVVAEKYCRVVAEDTLPSPASVVRGNCTCRDNMMETSQPFLSAQCEDSSKSTQGLDVMRPAAPYDGKRMTTLPRRPVQETWLPASALRAARGLMEMLLGGSLCAMVALPVAIAISRVIESQSYTAGLVPT